MRENPWNEKGVPESRSGIFTSIFSVTGRIGREAYYYRSLCFVILAMVMFGVASLFFGGTLALLASPVGKGLTVLLALAMLGTHIQRAHDIGISWKMPLLFMFVLPMINLYFSNFASLMSGGAVNPPLISVIINVVSVWYGHWLILWPGERKESVYGMPTREYRYFFSNQWEQAKREYFSFEGRINRKWFFGLSWIFGMTIWIAFMDLGEGYRTLIVPSLTMESVLRGALKGIAGVAGILVFGRAYLSLIMRRVQDSKWPHFFAHLFSLIFLLSGIGKLYLLFFGATEMNSLAQGIKILFSIFAMILEWISWLVLCVISSKPGENQYGKNPVEEGFLPGESTAEL